MSLSRLFVWKKYTLQVVAPLAIIVSYCPNRNWPSQWESGAATASAVITASSAVEKMLRINEMLMNEGMSMHRPLCILSDGKWVTSTGLPAGYILQDMLPGYIKYIVWPRYPVKWRKMDLDCKTETSHGKAVITKCSERRCSQLNSIERFKTHSPVSDHSIWLQKHWIFILRVKQKHNSGVGRTEAVLCDFSFYHTCLFSYSAGGFCVY